MARGGKRKPAARSARPDANRYVGNGTSLEISHDLGAVTLMSLTGFRQFRSYLVGDLDGTEGTCLDFEQDLHQNQFTEELQLTSNGSGPLHYVAGAFYFKERVHQLAANILQNTYNDNLQKSRSAAIYGEATYDLTSQLSLTAGGRYTWDHERWRCRHNSLDVAPRRLAMIRGTKRWRRSWNSRRHPPRSAISWAAKPGC